jgi:hypothetical protein
MKYCSILKKMIDQVTNDMEEPSMHSERSGSEKAA